MSTKAVRVSDPTSDAGVARVNMKFEIVVIPVSDIDRAKEFYAKIGWRLDAGLFEVIEVDVLVPGHDPQRIGDHRAVIGRGLQRAGIEVLAIGIVERWLRKLACRGVLQHVTAGGVEHVRAGVLLQDGDVEFLVGLGSERAALDRDADVGIARAEGCDRGVGGDGFRILTAGCVVAPPPFDADLLVADAARGGLPRRGGKRTTGWLRCGARRRARPTRGGEPGARASNPQGAQ